MGCLFGWCSFAPQGPCAGKWDEPKCHPEESDRRLTEQRHCVTEVIIDGVSNRRTRCQVVTDSQVVGAEWFFGFVDTVYHVIPPRSLHSSVGNKVFVSGNPPRPCENREELVPLWPSIPELADRLKAVLETLQQRMATACATASSEDQEAKPKPHDGDNSQETKRYLGMLHLLHRW